MMRVINAVAHAILALYALGISTIISFALSDIYIKPVNLISMVTDKINAAPGDKLVITNTYNRYKICIAHLQYFMLKDYDVVDGQERRDVVYREEAPALALLGRNVAVHVITIPDVADGDYVLMNTVANECTLVNRVDSYDDVIIHVKRP